MATRLSEDRLRQIEEAAFQVLSEKGYRAASMLTIAKRANASNETLYKLYGNKQALFQAIIKANAEDVVALLQEQVEGESDPVKTLRKLGSALLDFATGEKATIMFRAAAGDADDTGSLGPTMREVSRDVLMPLIADVMKQTRKSGKMKFRSADDVAEDYVALLLSDIQVQQTIGAVEPLTKQEMDKRGRRACDLILKLYGPDA